MVMPRDFYRKQFQRGTFGASHLTEALRRADASESTDEIISEMESNAPVSSRVPMVTSIFDQHRDLVHAMSVSTFARNSLSQHCASYFDYSQSAWQSQHKKNLYQSWRAFAGEDLSLRLLMGFPTMRGFSRALPDAPADLVNLALERLRVPAWAVEEYLTALLMDINGWAAWCAYQRWQAQLHNQSDDHLVQLLAIRLSWDYFIFDHLLSEADQREWWKAWEAFEHEHQRNNCSASVDWILQEAMEIAYQESLCATIASGAAQPATLHHDSPAAQVVFCIDVRSEVFRRALESCAMVVHTIGFAGFFGLPLSYAPLGTDLARPQLPGLLAPAFRVSDSTGSEESDVRIANNKQQQLATKSIWKQFRSSAASMFTYVESCGLFYAVPLIKNSLNLGAKSGVSNYKVSADSRTVRPMIDQRDHGRTPSTEALCDMLAKILINMSLTDGFARLVVMMGHGSSTTNNPHAAGLDCGACGGQSGEVNARLLASLLNNTEIRAGLSKRGISIPETTYLLAGLHNTTTDEVTIFDTDSVPTTHVAELGDLQNAFRLAGHQSRLERARTLNIEADGSTDAAALLQRFQARSTDWSQVRPEWGLANNAAFLVAPRSRSRGLNLQGRVFLHEYRSDCDSTGEVLEAIMTAPMLVTHWINMQYYASTVDNQLYGSGNKVLHNVVGGRIGVFEGNSGDLRIGLPMQSLHDGRDWRHTPLRLSVLIEAPINSIEAVIAKHLVVRNLVHHGWIHLFQINPQDGAITRYTMSGWESMQLCDELSASAVTILAER